MGKFGRHIRSASLTGYVELAHALGIDASALMRKAGVPRRCFDDPETPIGVSAALRLLEASAQAAGADDFGLRLARARHLSSLGPMAFVLREETTGQQALETLCHWLSRYNASLLAQVERADGLVIVRLEFLVDELISARQGTEFLVGAVCKVMQDIVGPAWRPKWASFVHGTPPDARAHHALFGRRVEFDAEFNGLVCSAAELAKPLPRTDPQMARYARAYMEAVLRPAAIGDADTIRHMVGTLLPGGRCTVEQVAAQLGVDRRTVHRRLQADDETFTSVLRSVRRERAMRRLQGGEFSVADLADQLGFSSASAFAHWFRGEFGTSVTAWRRGR